MLYRWDAFNQNEEGRGSASEKHTDLIKKASYCLKITTSLLAFCLVFVAATISKGALFFMIAQIAPPTHNITSQTNLSSITNPPLQYCPNYTNALKDDISTGSSGAGAQLQDTTTSAPETTKYYVDYDETQSISWMW